MADHEKKFCPRCNSVFECKTGNISQCQCSGIQLANETKEWIEKRFQDCLCKNCLAELNNPQHLFVEKFRKGIN